MWYVDAFASETDREYIYACVLRVRIYRIYVHRSRACLNPIVGVVNEENTRDKSFLSMGIIPIYGCKCVGVCVCVYDIVCARVKSCIGCMLFYIYLRSSVPHCHGGDVGLMTAKRIIMYRRGVQIVDIYIFINI